MSRLSYALSSETAQSHLREVLVSAIKQLVKDSGARSLAVGGNTTMIAMLLGLPLQGLAFAPYTLPWRGDETVGLGNGLPPAYVPPLLGPFIGADISAGLAAVCAKEPEYPYLLADLGTNGEFVLAVDEDHFFAASVPMGPAIEGVGLCCGSMAGDGVVSKVRVGQKGLHVDVQGAMAGISGTGYVSLLAVLRRIGLLDEDGHFQVSSSIPLTQQIASKIGAHPLGKILQLNEEIFLAERDVEEFLKAKAAVNVAIGSLVRRTGLGVADINSIYLAGALGEYADCLDLMELGFFPRCWQERILVEGNTSLAGLMLALEKLEVREWLSNLPLKVSVENLVEQEDFETHFLNAMRFVWM